MSPAHTCVSRQQQCRAHTSAFPPAPPPSWELLPPHTSVSPANLLSVAILASEEATKARENFLCPRERGSRRVFCNWTYRRPNWPRLSWGSFGSSWSSGPGWARGPRGTLDSRLSLFTLRFIKTRGYQQAEQTLHTTTPRAQGRSAWLKQKR